MSFFSERQQYLQFFPNGAELSLRKNQRGAIHALAAHFTLHDTPAIITMPTGSGKTTVICATPFLLKAKRVLVIAPSVMLKGHMANAFTTLNSLKKTGLFTLDAAPKVKVVTGTVKTPEAWEELRAFDVVVVTPHTVSPARLQVPLPSEDLFDVVIVDEAHHSPAHTWNELLDAFPRAQRVLFTATPYRSDSLELNGEHVYTYPTLKAFEDKIFGEVNPQRITPQDGETADLAIARQAEITLMQDRGRGHHHYVLARAATKDHAEALLDVYGKNTSLRMQIIYSKHTLKHNQGILDLLEQGELDGIITVDMLSEGVDIPRFKIAAVHALHKSLAITLQFIGRFARTGEDKVGPASFIYTPSDGLNAEIERLYEEDAVWATLLPQLADARIEKEEEDKAFFQGFDPGSFDYADFAGFSLFSLRPYHHVKVYDLPDGFEIPESVTLESNHRTVFKKDYPKARVSVLIFRYLDKPKWIRSDFLTQYHYELCIVYHNKEHGFLFISSTEKTEQFYQQILKHFIASTVSALPSPVSMSITNKSLHNLTQVQVFNVGMRKIRGNRDETYLYRIGNRADNVIDSADGKIYDRGHAFCKAQENGKDVTLGFSSAAKVWSNRTDKIPDFIHWCDALAIKFRNGSNPVTGTNLDYLGVREPIASLKGFDLLTIDWNPRFYEEPGKLTVEVHGQPQLLSPEDAHLWIDYESIKNDRFEFHLEIGSLTIKMMYLLGSTFRVENMDEKITCSFVDQQGRTLEIGEYFQSHPPVFRCVNGDMIEGREAIRLSSLPKSPFDAQLIQAIDWRGAGVDISKEFGTPNSIHNWLEQRLVGAAQADDVVFYDHGSGETGDFITFAVKEDCIHIHIYHVKSCKNRVVGERVSDVYEVCGQVIKSVKFRDLPPAEMFKKIKHRFENTSGKKFCNGDLAKLETLLKSRLPIEIHIGLVQPGMAASKITERTSNVLAATQAYIMAQCAGFLALGSS
ncbi:DEAD/DEAH box helicase [Deinococcus cellulosilyticus]|uniref:Uncharacterized protein n=1 Tax=Deinococcus cellulosilyticus (strain DSM 18568 / NBRC 106333 / KACC 11606 / 5516J-15) TaxID=1223518 RepID=A0A511N9P8_DEIC1|nr:DEAD/DEAH box helicase family protein [Deinococcus cellulosilyticus]GEM49555.1 hypothetical protein DC3_51900 [Deinococcus cellulosilyticus NBRC 106333 = KACC 11606]